MKIDFKTLHNLIWQLFWFSIALLLVGAVVRFYNGIDTADLSGQVGAKYLLAPIFLIGHAAYMLGWRRTAIFILVTAGLGFVGEYLGLHYGASVSTGYAYREGYFMIASVPVLILIFWSFFIYLGYSMSNAFLAWTNRVKPSLIREDWTRVASLAAFDGLIVLAIDLFMDPIKVALGDWHWFERGWYFGVPMGNFIGWFVVTFVSMAIFRYYEYSRPQEGYFTKKKYLLMPVLEYGAIAVDFLATALVFHFYGLIAVGFSFMIVIVLGNLFLYGKMSKNISQT